MKTRTLARVTKSGNEHVEIVLPGWRLYESIKLPVELFPVRMRRKLKVGHRFHLQADLNAETLGGLQLSDFEE